MLFVWDIHSTRKYIHPCIQALRAFIQRHSKDNTIIFVWDYVYHFNYDRVALHTLFSYWVELVQEWKHLIILAWNHDWIHNQFVFAEWQLAFETFTSSWSWSIQFITKPTRCTIQWREMLLFPFTTQFDERTGRNEYNELITSTVAKERISGYANSVLHTMIDEWKSIAKWWEKLLVVHHRYIAKTAFPWQFARFGYGSPALSNHWLDDDQIMMISWHLHQPFIERNYCCIWSIWSTSPLEINQQKYLFRLHEDTWKLTASPIHINPYYQTTPLEIADWLELFVESILVQSKKHLDSSIRAIEYDSVLWELSYDTTTLTVVTDEVWWIDNLNDSIKQQVWTIRQKQTSQSLGTLITSMQASSKELDKNFSDWKTLLSEFLEAKYGETKQQYIQDLEKLGIL